LHACKHPWPVAATRRISSRLQSLPSTLLLRNLQSSSLRSVLLLMCTAPHRQYSTIERAACQSDYYLDKRHCGSHCQFGHLLEGCSSRRATKPLHQRGLLHDGDTVPDLLIYGTECGSNCGPGDYVTISASRYPFANVMTQGGRGEDWVKILSAKLNWNSRQRQEALGEWSNSGG
jgi:hypothetical protein